MVMKKIFTLFFFVVLQHSAYANDSKVLMTPKEHFNVSQTNDDQLAVPAALVNKQSADSYYIKKNYELAINLYESLLQKGISPVLYYNLGNSYYQVNKIGKAILNYERALRIDPGNDDIRTNLELARAKTIDKVTYDPGFFYVSWIKSIVNIVGIDSWAFIAVSLFVLMLASLFTFLMSNNIRLKQMSIISCITSFLLFILANIFAWQQKRDFDSNDAIILSTSAIVRSTPSSDGTNLFVVHEGLKVTIVDSSMKDWIEISLGDGKAGWITTSDIEKI